MSWVRIEAAIFQDAKMIRAGFWGGQVFIAAITMAKLQRWEKGVVPKADFDEFTISHHLNAVTVSNVTDLLRDGIAACVRVGLLLDEPDCYVIAAWAKHQQDPTNAQRQARFRANKKLSRLHNEVTVTGRDVTGRDVEPPLPPVTAGGSSPSASSNGHGLGPREEQIAFIILDRLCAGKGCSAAEQAFGLEMRKAIRTGSVAAEDVREMIRDWSPKDGFRQAVGTAMNVERNVLNSRQPAP